MKIVHFPRILLRGYRVFASIEDLRRKFEQAKYIVDDVTICQVFVAGQLKKPVLIEGPPGGLSSTSTSHTL